MNEKAITKFLAEQACGWYSEIVNLGIGGDDFENWIDKKTDVGVIAVSEFDPVEYLEHAFMVEDAIYKMDVLNIAKYLRELLSMVGEETDNTDTHIWTLYFMSIAFVVHASPKQRCLAATRVLATDAQLQGWGL